MTLSTSPTLEDRTSDRHIRTPGTCNFRDLGGYPTVDGRRLRRGMVYRSGVLDRLDGYIFALPLAALIAIAFPSLTTLY